MSLLIVLAITVIATGISLPIYWNTFGSDNVFLYLQNHKFKIFAFILGILLLVSASLWLILGESFGSKRIAILFGEILAISLAMALAIELYNSSNALGLLEDSSVSNEREKILDEISQLQTRLLYIKNVTVERVIDASSDNGGSEVFFQLISDDSELDSLDAEIQELSIS